MSRTGDPYPLVRSPWSKDRTAPALSPAEAEVVARFEAAEYPAEVLLAHRESEAAEQDAR